jgi:prepilin-type N-terminal cleavage/methylation domain-containing protein
MGFSLVEMMVATLLLSAVALAVTQTLISALQARARNELQMRATELAAEGIEQLRAGHTLPPLAANTGFERSAAVTEWSGHAGVQRIEVTIAWNDGERRTFQLTTLVRR